MRAATAGPIEQHGPTSKFDAGIKRSMAAPGGPDDETWRRMSPRAKYVYWVLVVTVASWVAYLWLLA